MAHIQSQILTEDRLNGYHEAWLAYRPERDGLPIREDTLADFLPAVQDSCQFWGGAGSILIPAGRDGTISETYTKILAGSAIDHVVGMKHFGLFHMPHAKVDLNDSRGYWGRQPAFGLLKYKSSDAPTLPLQVVTLEPDDPWQPIYAACLGSLPQELDDQMLRDLHYVPDLSLEDFIHVDRERAVGSIEDLLERLTDNKTLTPRQYSMLFLAYGNGGSTSIRDQASPIPRPAFKRFDAGPNVIVLCSPGSTLDHALLWNLRAALGDRFVLPIGIPVRESSPEIIRRLMFHERKSHNGLASAPAYITSASLSLADLSAVRDEVGDHRLGVASHEEILAFGRPGAWNRSEMLVWEDGHTRIIPHQAGSREDLLTKRSLLDTTRMYIDVEVPDQPFPTGTDIRIDSMNWVFYAGSATLWSSLGSRFDAVDIDWPSRLLTAKCVTGAHDLTIRESEPGRSARVALNNFDGLWDISNLLHAPLLELLEEMAARHGFGWYKNRLRLEHREADPLDAVGPTADELPEKPFGAFRRVLGSERATKHWLLWAELAGWILKGVQLQCHLCKAKQWVPINAFAPPIICRGCAEQMKTPFADRPNIDFRYRLSERLRRVYENDAMGHLLVMHHLQALFGSSRRNGMVGLHPGMEVLKSDTSSPMGEADVLMVRVDENPVPVEVKRTAAGFTMDEISKLNALCDAMRSPWSGIAVCQYGDAVGSEFPALERRSSDEEPYFRVLLSYDRLLDPQPTWSMGSDPFSWQPLTPDAIAARETDFKKRLDGGTTSGSSWLEEAMLHRPPLDP